MSIPIIWHVIKCFFNTNNSDTKSIVLDPKKVILSLETDHAKQTTDNGDKHGCYCLSWSHCKNTGTDPNIYVMKDGASARIPPLPFKITWIGSRSGPVGRVVE